MQNLQRIVEALQPTPPPTQRKKNIYIFIKNYCDFLFSFLSQNEFNFITTTNSINSDFILISSSNWACANLGKRLLLEGQIQSCACWVALMHRGVGWPPGLANFAVSLCRLWKIPRITSDPPEAPKAIYLSKVRGSWVTAVWEPQPQPEFINLYTTHTHAHTGSLFI